MLFRSFVYLLKIFLVGLKISYKMILFLNKKFTITKESLRIKHSNLFLENQLYLLPEICKLFLVLLNIIQKYYSYKF